MKHETVVLIVLLLSAIAGGASVHTTASASLTTNAKQGLIPPPRRDTPGKRIALTTGTLYIPDFYRTEVSSGTEAVVFFHGAAWCAEQNFYDARKNAVLVSITMPMDKYPTAFATSASLHAVLREIQGALQNEGIPSRPLSRVCLASFSGGYSAVRELLRNLPAEGEETTLPPVTDVVLADSLYATKEEGSTETLNHHAMAPFVAYARRASRPGGPTFLFTHLYPPEKQHRGNTTTLAATHLIRALDVTPEPASGTSSRGAKLLYRASRHNFHIFGYAGMTTQDHFEHFYGISDLLKQTSLTPAS